MNDRKDKQVMTKKNTKQDGNGKVLADGVPLRFSMDKDAAEWWKQKAAELGMGVEDVMRGVLETWKENAEKDVAGLRSAKVEDLPLWMTAKEVAAIMGLHHLTVLKWIRAGVIPSRKFGSRKMVSRNFFAWK